MTKLKEARKRICTPCTAKRFGMLIVLVTGIIGALIATASPEQKETYVSLFHSVEYVMNAILLGLIILIDV